MKRGAGDGLKGQAQIFVAAATAAASWFRRPAPSALSAARTARLRALSWKDNLALREAVEHSAQSVAEAARWGVEPDAELTKAADAVRESAQAIANAAGAKGRERADFLVSAKKWAFEAERLRRGIRETAHEDPSLAAGLKRETVALRLSNAAEAAHQLCDALAGEAE